MDSPAKFIDHTLLKADCTEAEIADLCEEAVEYGFAAVCIPPVYVPTVNKLLYGSEVSVCTVVGFPMGYQMTSAKAFEAGSVLESGAAEVDMVINLSAARAQDLALVEDDIHRVVEVCGESTVKVIIECCLFEDAVKRKLAEVVVAAGADFVKTSTGFSSAGATVEDVKLLSEVVGNRIGVKAAGGIRDWSTCQKMLIAGATRIGSSAGVSIVQQWRKSAGLGCR